MPRMATDGYAVTRAQESALWKAVMLDLYGDDWSVRLVGAEADAPEPEAAAAGPAGTSAPSGLTDSPGSGVDPRVTAGIASDPGSGVETPIMEQSVSRHTRRPDTKGSEAVPTGSRNA